MMRNFFIAITAFLITQPASSSLPCKFIDTVNISDGYYDSNQNFVYNGDIYPVGMFQEFDYVEDHSQNKTSVDPHLRGCVCKLKPCIRVCCFNKAEKNSKCLGSDKFNVKNEDNKDEEVNINDNKYGILYSRPCSDMYILEPEGDERDEWNFLKNGSILSMESIHSTDEYCLEITKESTATAYICFADDYDARFIIYPIGMLISIPFLIITFLVYAFIPELRNLHGKCLMCYTFAMTLLYTSLSMIQTQVFGMEPSQLECIALGYFVYISIFLSFFWMNVMCYDIWTIARHGMANRSFKEDRKTFFNYCIYAFGIPILIAGIVVAIDNFELLDVAYLPLFGSMRCYLRSDTIVEAIYLRIPTSILFIINFIFFVSTARIIWKVQGITNDINAQNRSVAIRRRFYIYCRLFLIMGVMWCMETISWIYDGNHLIFYITDMFNCIQGVLIFVVCVCDRKTRTLIANRCCSSNKAHDESATYAGDIGTSNHAMTETK